MSQVQLPAYLTGIVAPDLSQKAVAGLGASLPPHISIRGNQFTLVDAAGTEQPVGPVLDACIADVSDTNCKKYFSKPWDPNSADPPDCWSANGIGPSRDAVNPQSPTCAVCPQNVRGSAVSKMSGAAIKACRDEKWLALILPSQPGMMFQLVVTPGSFSNWKAYNEKLRGSGLNLWHVVTRLSFSAKETGVLEFTGASFIDENVAKSFQAALAEKKSDIYVGRNDVARDALPAPQGNGALLPAPTAPISTVTAVLPAAPPPVAPVSTSPVGLASAVPPATDGRRKRRTAAEQPAAPAATPTMAPFMPQAPAPATAPAVPAQPNNFGIQQGVQPNAELQDALKQVFG